MYSWEEKYKRSWDVLQEDGSGSLAGVISNLEAQLLKKKRIVKDSLQVKRGIIRYIYIVIDRSIAMAEIDLKPTRIEVVCQILTALVKEFFDENPLSQIGILYTMEGLAYKLCDLSSNPSEVANALARKEIRETSGVPSLMNVLELGCNSLRYIIESKLSQVPDHGSREMLGIFGSLSFWDPGDIEKTIDKLKREKVRVSMVGLASQVQICNRIADETGGFYNVLIDDRHLKELIFQIIIPPAIKGVEKTSGLIPMGFPQKVVGSTRNELQVCAW